MATYGPTSYNVLVVTGDVPLSAVRIIGATLLPCAAIPALWLFRRHPLF